MILANRHDTKESRLFILAATVCTFMDVVEVQENLTQKYSPSVPTLKVADGMLLKVIFHSPPGPRKDTPEGNTGDVCDVAEQKREKRLAKERESFISCTSTFVGISA